MDPRAREDHDLLCQLQADRSLITDHYQDLARFHWPDQAVMHRTAGTPAGGKRGHEILSITAPIAADRCAKMLKSITAPKHRRYQKLAIEAEGLKDNEEVKRWLEHGTDVIFRRRYRPGSGFDGQYLQGCKSAVVFGPMATFVEDKVSKTGESYNYYQALSVANTFLIFDDDGRVCGFARWLEYNASQLQKKFGRANLPEKILKALNSQLQGQRLAKWKVVHVVQPLPGPQAVTGFTHSSRYSLEDGYSVLEERGHRGCPIAGARYDTLPGEDYGRSIAMLVLPATKGLNRTKRDYIVGLHKQVDPSLLAYDEDGVMTTIKAIPGMVTPGGMTADGKPLVAAFGQPGPLDWVDKFMEDEKREINDAFMTTLFQILASDPPRVQTAYEVSVRELEKSALISPSSDNLDDQYFTALVHREIAIALEAGDLEPMPDALEEHREKITVTHTGDLSVAQQAEQIIAIQRTLEVAPLMDAQQPGVSKRIDWDKAMKLFAEGVGVTASIIRSDDELDEIQAADEQQRLAAAAAELAPKAGAGAKSFAEAESIRSQQAAGLGALV